VLAMTINIPQVSGLQPKPSHPTRASSVETSVKVTTMSQPT
jgi:hypothetical protein